MLALSARILNSYTCTATYIERCWNDYESNRKPFALLSDHSPEAPCPTWSTLDFSKPGLADVNCVHCNPLSHGSQLSLLENSLWSGEITELMAGSSGHSSRKWIWTTYLMVSGLCEFGLNCLLWSWPINGLFWAQSSLPNSDHLYPCVTEYVTQSISFPPFCLGSLFIWRTSVLITYSHHSRSSTGLSHIQYLLLPTISHWVSSLKWSSILLQKPWCLSSFGRGSRFLSSGSPHHWSW